MSLALKNHTNIDISAKSGTVTDSANAANFLLSVNVEDISNYARSGHDLVITLKNGKNYQIKDFFINGPHFHNLILIGADGRYLVNFDAALSSEGDGIIDPQVVYEKLGQTSSVGVLLGILGAAGAIGGIAAAANNGGSDGGGGNEHHKNKPDIPKLIDPDTGKSIDPDNPTSINKPIIKGEGNPGDVIIIEDGNGNPLGETKVDEDGNWEWGTEEDWGDKALDEGENEVVIKVKDPAGNVSDGETIIIDIDTEGSDASIGGIYDPETDEKIEGDGPINIDRPVIKGEGGDPGDKVIIKDKDGNPLGDTKVGEDGSWTWRPDKPLEDGEHEFVVEIEDEAGNVGKEDSIKIETDGTRVYLGRAAVSGDGWFFDVPALGGDGQYKFEAVVHDKDGKAGAASDAFDLWIKTGTPAADVVIDHLEDKISADAGDRQPGSDGQPVTDDSFSTQNLMNTGTDKIVVEPWIDLNRDGYMDFFGADDTESNGLQMFINAGDGEFDFYQLFEDNTGGFLNVLAEDSGVVAFDKMDPELLSMAYGDAGFQKELSGVGMNNNGTVDVPPPPLRHG